MEITLGKQNKKSDFSDTEMEVILSGIEKNQKNTSLKQEVLQKADILK